MERDTAFEMATARIRYGAGVTREVGMDLADMGVRRVVVVADPRLVGPVGGAAGAAEGGGGEDALFDRVTAEATGAPRREADGARRAGARGRVVYGAAVRGAAEAGAPHLAAELPGSEPDQRRVGDRGTEDGGCLPAAGDERRDRRGGTGDDAACCGLRGPR